MVRSKKSWTKNRAMKLMARRVKVGMNTVRMLLMIGQPGSL